MSLIRDIRIQGYRSVREMRLDLDQITVVVGPNGSGKTNLYRALELLSQAAHGRLLRAIAGEGGLGSIAYAGPLETRKGSKNKPVRVELEVAWHDLSVMMACGFPIPTNRDRANPSAFNRDTEIKEEVVWPTRATRRAFLYRRESTGISARGTDGRVESYFDAVRPWELGLSDLHDRDRYPEVDDVRRRLTDWRFYHQFRTDPDSPLRQPQPGYRSPVLDPDGRNLAATFQTIWEIGDRDALDEAVAAVFEGGQASLVYNGDSTPREPFRLEVHLPGLVRPLRPREFSDGQLRMLCLACALLSPRPPAFLVLNEPETSLSRTMLRALATLIVRASRDSQIWLTTHALPLADALVEAGARRYTLEKRNGETRYEGQGLL